MKSCYWLILAPVLVFSAGVEAGEQATCAVGEVLENGSVGVVIDGKPYLAITPDMARETLEVRADLEAANEKLVVRTKEIETWKQEVQLFEQTLQQKNDYITGLEDLNQEYKELIADYRKLKRVGRLNLQGGVGVVDGDPAALFGLGVNRFRLWGFAQEDNAGVLLGLQYPLF